MCGDGTCVSACGSGFNDLICGPAEGLITYVPTLGNGDRTNLYNLVVIGSMCVLNNNDKSNYVCLPNPGPFFTNTRGLTPEVPIRLGYTGVANYKQLDGCADISYSNCTLYWTCLVNNVQSEAIVMESSATGQGAIVQLKVYAGVGDVQALTCDGHIPPDKTPSKPPQNPPPNMPPPPLKPKTPTESATFAAMPSFKLNIFTIFYTTYYLSIVASICQAF